MMPGLEQADAPPWRQRYPQSGGCSKLEDRASGGTQGACDLNRSELTGPMAT